MASYIRALRCRTNETAEMVNVLSTGEIAAIIRDHFNIAVGDMPNVYLVTDDGEARKLSEITAQSVRANDPNWRNRLIRLRINDQHTGDFIRFEY
jgi:PhoPQ-activated pathogenicity-related protein